MRTDWVSKTVDIAPGHRILIAEFVNKVQNMIKPKNTLPIKRKARHVPSESSKKQMLVANPNSESDGSEITVNYEASTADLADIASKIRIQIAKWQRIQSQSQLAQLKEHEQFEVRISRSEKPDTYADVCITCTMCDKHLPLTMGSKHTSYSISNWSRHVKACILKKQHKSRKVTQATISTFLSPITSKTSQGSSKPEGDGETSTFLCISESSSGNQTTSKSPPVELNSESKQNF